MWEDENFRKAVSHKYILKNGNLEHFPSAFQNNKQIVALISVWKSLFLKKAVIIVNCPIKSICFKWNRVNSKFKIFSVSCLPMLCEYEKSLTCMISSFHHSVNESFALLGCYAVPICNLLLTFRDNLSFPSSKVKQSNVWLLHSSEVVYFADEQHSYPQTTECFYLDTYGHLRL
jgi:hypothetical protein